MDQSEGVTHRALISVSNAIVRSKKIIQHLLYEMYAVA